VNRPIHLLVAFGTTLTRRIGAPPAIGGASENVGSLRLWPLPSVGTGVMAQVASVAIVFLLLATRFTLLPDGPWEQDEAIFATGVLDFDIVRHRPHPPGFPGWILLGKLLNPFVGDPVLSLRIWSILASVAGVVILAQLLVPLCGSRSALLGALVYAFAPLTWSHSARAFACTPALTLTLVAIWLWLAYSDSDKLWSSLVAWALVGFASTIRPQLAPELAVVAVLGFWADGHRPRRVLLGVTVGLLVVIVVFGVAISVGGGPAAVWKATSSHFAEAKEVAGGRVPWSDLGIVRGLGGSVSAAVVVALTVIGLGVGLMRNRWSGAWLLLLVAVTAWALLYMHSPSIPRYNVALLLAMTPAVLLALSVLPQLAQTLVLIAVGLLTVFTTFPVVLAMHDHPLPPVAALRHVAMFQPAAVLYPHKIFSFGRLASYMKEFPGTVTDVTGAGLGGGFRRGSHALEGPSLRFLPEPMVCSEFFENFPPAAWELSQKRFTKAIVARDPVVLGEGIHNVERLYDEAPFAWLSDAAELHVPGPSDRLLLRLRVMGDREPQRVVARVGEEQLASMKLEGGLRFLWLTLPSCENGCVVRLELPDAGQSEYDSRKLSARLEAAIAFDPRARTSQQRWSPGSPDTLSAAGVQLVGTYPPETFGEGRAGAWTKSEATATFRGEGGIIVVQLGRAWYAPTTVELTSDVERVLVELGSQLQAVALRIGGSPGEKSVSIRAPTFIPGELAPRSSDHRQLGVMLLDAEYFPQPNCRESGDQASRGPSRTP
jgi:hypothetical protein